MSACEGKRLRPIRLSFLVLSSFFLLLLALPYSSQAADKDYYKVLGVKRSATPAEIKKAWRRISLDLHPDKNPSPDAAAKFQEASNAYSVLSNEEKREIYDREGEEGVKRMDARAQQGGMDPFGSVFEAFGFGGFGGGRRRDEEMRTPNVVIPLRVTLKQLFQGDILEMTYVRQTLCLNHKDCMKTCSDCQAAGIKIKHQQLAPGFVQQIQVRDDSCVARGKCWKPNCKACPNGQTQPEEASLTVDVQPGMRDDEEIIFAEVADEKAGHTAGDLVLKIKTVPHPTFKRSGDDLHITLKVDLVNALVGFDKVIKHVDEREVKLSKPSVTSHGEVQRVKGQGMPKRTGSGGFGDLVVTWEVDFPQTVTDAQKKKLKEIFA